MNAPMLAFFYLNLGMRTIVSCLDDILNNTYLNAVFEQRPTFKLIHNASSGFR